MQAPQLIVHKLRELSETLGVLVIAIVKVCASRLTNRADCELQDLDGFEICLVSSETFDRAVLAAADWKGPDWMKRTISENEADWRKTKERSKKNRERFSV